MIEELNSGCKIVDTRNGSTYTVDIVEEYPDGIMVYTMESKCIPLQFVQLEVSVLNKLYWEYLLSEQQFPKWLEETDYVKNMFSSLQVSEETLQKARENMKKRKNSIVFSISLFGYQLILKKVQPN
jgi:hypothetical protein